MKKYKIELQTPPLEKDALDLFLQLGEHNKMHYSNYRNANSYAIFIKEGDQILGGIAGQIWLGSLRIERLFVQEKIRGQGYGGILLNKAENFGRQHNAKFVSTETLSFQNTLDFYLIHGYQIVLKEDEYEQGITMYHLRKSLNAI